MSKIILPIKPQYVYKILAESKRVEYRKVIPRRSDVSHVVIYATAPISKVVGEFELKGVLCDTPDEIWEKTKEIGGIEQNDYNHYFASVNKAYALQIGSVREYSELRSLSCYGIKAAPQNFIYID